jgi:hypothetical protein
MAGVLEKSTHLMEAQKPKRNRKGLRSTIPFKGTPPMK